MEILNKKIEEAYKLALDLGLDKATESEKSIYREVLVRLVVQSIEQVRIAQNNLLHDISHSIK